MRERIERGDRIETGRRRWRESTTTVSSGRHSDDHHSRPKSPQTAGEPGLGIADSGTCRARVSTAVVGCAIGTNRIED